MPLTSQQATIYPCLCQTLLDTHRQVWLSLLWGYCSFLLAPGVHKVLFVPSKSMFPNFVAILQSNPTGLQCQIPWGFSVPLLDPRVGKSVVDPSSYQCKNFFGIIVLQFIGCQLSGFMFRLTATSSKKANATCFMSHVCCGQSPCPHNGPICLAWELLVLVLLGRVKSQL